jgi:hypothetical protein
MDKLWYGAYYRQEEMKALDFFQPGKNRPMHTQAKKAGDFKLCLPKDV